jgi:pyridoxamine 5'-phosphate oxidase
VPDTYEFWEHRDDRLHDRRLFTRRGAGWESVRLQP